MKHGKTRGSWRVMLGVVPTALAVIALAAGTPEARGDRPVRRAAAEKAVGGITAQENYARQQELNAILTAEMPAGVHNNPVRVELTQQDRDDLAEPAPNGAAPLRIGVVKSISPSVNKLPGQPFKGGVLQQNQDGSFVWALTVTSPDAQSIRVHFTSFSLPANTEMYFLSQGGEAHGPYLGQGRNGNGDFWTHSINSETGVIMLRYSGNAPEADRGKISFAVADLGHIHGRPPLPVEQSHDSWPCSDNASCVVDANCGSAGPAEAAKDAVAKMEWIQTPFIYTCTGGLIADTDPGTQIPYFLTANHCLAADNSSLETFFFYATDSCNGGCPDSLVTGGTPPAPSTIGVTVMATGSAGDFTLLKLDQAPPAGTTFLGWNNSPIAFTDGADLHRISNANFGPQVYSHHQVDATAPTCSSWPRGQRIYSTDITGATMGGSSGSPVVNSAGEVVGQLSGCCGFNCAEGCCNQIQQLGWVMA